MLTLNVLTYPRNENRRKLFELGVIPQQLKRKRWQVGNRARQEGVHFVLFHSLYSSSSQLQYPGFKGQISEIFLLLMLMSQIWFVL